MARDSLVCRSAAISNLVRDDFGAFAWIDGDHRVVLAERQSCPSERIQADWDERERAAPVRRVQLDILLPIGERHHRLAVAAGFVTRLIRTAEAEKPRPGEHRSVKLPLVVRVRLVECPA